MKSNIQIVKDYVAGVRPIIQVGYEGKKYVKRAVGETWTDNSGQEWEQKTTGPQKVNRVANIVREAIGVNKCKCGQEIKWGSLRDRFFYNRTGKCEDCLIEYETKLRVVGAYDDYDTYKRASNELGAMKDLKEKIDETVKFFSGKDTDVTMLCNSEGFIERWKTTNKEEILENAAKDLIEVNRRIEALDRIKEECREKYEATAAKYNL